MLHVANPKKSTVKYSRKKAGQIPPPLPRPQYQGQLIVYECLLCAPLSNLSSWQRLYIVYNLLVYTLYIQHRESLKLSNVSIYHLCISDGGGGGVSTKYRELGLTIVGTIQSKENHCYKEYQENNYRLGNPPPVNERSRDKHILYVREVLSIFIQ